MNISYFLCILFMNVFSAGSHFISRKTNFFSRIKGDCCKNIKFFKNFQIKFVENIDIFLDLCYHHKMKFNKNLW